MCNSAVTGKSSVTIVINQDTWLAHAPSHAGNTSQGNTPRRRATTPSETGEQRPLIAESGKEKRPSNTTTAPRSLKGSSHRALSTIEAIGATNQNKTNKLRGQYLTMPPANNNKPMRY